MPDATPNAVEEVKQFSNVVQRWSAEIKAYEKATEQWRKDSKRIIDRYKLERQRRQPELQHRAQFNILWSNIKTASPALYSRTPLPSIERRHRDQDIVGRVAAAMLERAVATEIEFDDFDVVMRSVVLDYQLTGRGIPWVRYEADIREERRDLRREEGPDGISLIMDGERAVGPEEIQDMREDDDGPFIMDVEVVSERAPVDYVFWEDFGHTPAKSWAELEASGAVWRRVAMTRKKLIERFGPEKGRKIPLKILPDGIDDKEQKKGLFKGIIKKAMVYEIWDAVERKVYWINLDTKDAPLDEKDFILDLTGKFPCPRAAYQTLTNDSLIPIPDYLQYEDMADELDDLTERISVLQEALQARGVYDASMEGIGKLLADTTPNNAMIPVSNWTALAGKGGLDAVVDWLPIRDIAEVMIRMDERRERLKQQIFEVSGLSDIIRGSTNPNETLGAQRIKGQFATLRLDEGQREIARVARDIIRLKAEIIAEQFDDTTIREISGFDHMPEITRIRQQAGEQGTEMAFRQALTLIRTDRARGFRIDIETDSTVVVDEEQMRQGRVEFLQAAGGFLQQALPVAQAVPAMAPLLGEMLLFGVRAFKTARGLESSFEDALEQLQNPQDGQQDQGPSPEEMAAQQQAQADQQRMQMDQQKAAADAQLAQQKVEADIQLAQMKLENERQTKEAELAIKREQAAGELALKRDIEQARLQIDAAREQARAQAEQNPQVALNLDAENAIGQVASTLQGMASDQTQILARALQGIEEATERLAAPKRIIFENGRPVGVEPVLTEV